MKKKPNIVFVFGDQWRGQAFGYAGDKNVKTPAIDKFSEESVVFSNAVSGCPVCSPYRASLMTGQYPLTHGVFVNDQCLRERADAEFLAESFGKAGYQTAYIGKWHVDGKGRNNFVPPERRIGFQWWKGYECTHDYNDSYYYFNSPEKTPWGGYDAIAQTKEAIRFLQECDKSKPFMLILSWGPPHDPYETAPEKYRRMYDAEKIELRPNVPEEVGNQAREMLAGYYAHCSALDDCFAGLLDGIRRNGLENNTIVIFTSDHGDMLGSQGGFNKQKPWDESIRVPFLIRDSETRENFKVADFLDSPDLMPTLLGLAGLQIPPTVQGDDLSGAIRERGTVRKESVLLMLPVTFHQWTHNNGGREFRGVVTERHTYVRELKGPWLLYDNKTDPYQMRNFVADKEHETARNGLDALLRGWLDKHGDEFREEKYYVKKYGIRLNERGDVFYE